MREKEISHIYEYAGLLVCSFAHVTRDALPHHTAHIRCIDSTRVKKVAAHIFRRWQNTMVAAWCAWLRRVHSCELCPTTTRRHAVGQLARYEAYYVVVHSHRILSRFRFYLFLSFQISRLPLDAMPKPIPRLLASPRLVCMCASHTRAQVNDMTIYLLNAVPVVPKDVLRTMVHAAKCRNTSK